MVVQIRHARFGCRNRLFYRVMAADSHSPRDGKHLEVLGYYNPLPRKDGGKRMGLKFDRVKTSAGEEKAKAVRKKQERMVVRIRVARFGCRNRPFYRVMAADSRSPRDGKHLEVLGYYSPFPRKDGGKRMGLKFDRLKYWLSVGGTTIKSCAAHPLSGCGEKLTSSVLAQNFT